MKMLIWRPAVMGTSISYVPTTGFDIHVKQGQTSKVITRSQCITTMMVYENKSLEELRFEDYQLGRRGTEDGYGTSLYRFEAVRCTELVYKNGDYVESSGRLQAVTAMKEYLHASFDELRLEDYRDGRGPRFNQFAERSVSVFGKVFKPSSQKQNETVYCNLINNLNITLPSVNFLGTPSQQRQIINAKRQLQQHFKPNKSLTNNPTNQRQPDKLKTSVLNKSLDTVMSTVGQISHFDNNVRDTADTNCSYDSEGSHGDKDNVHSGYPSNDDAEMVLGNKTGRGKDLTTGVENVVCSSSGDVRNAVKKDVAKDNITLKRGIDASRQSNTILTNVRQTSSPSQVKTREKGSKNNFEKGDCDKIVNSCRHDGEQKSKLISIDVNAKKSDITLHMTNERQKNGQNDCDKESRNTKSEYDCFNNIDEPQCDSNLQSANADNGIVNQESIENKTNIISVTTQINKLSNITFLNKDNDSENKETYLFNSENGDIVETHDEAIKDNVTIDEAIDLEPEQQGPGVPLPDNTDQNNTSENAKFNETNNIFRFDAAPKPRMIIKPSKLQNIISFKTPNSKKHIQKSIFSGYPFINPNSRKRFNFDKDNDLNKKATLNAHLELFSNNSPKPESVINNNGITVNTARYIRKFTPFSFQTPDTTYPNNSVTSSTPSVKATSSPFIRVSFTQKCDMPHSNAFNSVRSSLTTVSVPNTLFASNTASIISTPQTTDSIPPATFPPITNFKPFNFSTNTSEAFTIASIKSPSLTIKPAPCSNTASSFSSNFGVDIVNYGASTSKQCTTKESMSPKGDIAPSFKDLSVSNDTDLDVSELSVTQSGRATSIDESIKRKSPAVMSVEERNAVNESDKANANHQPSVQSNDSRSNLLTETKLESASAFKGASVPSSFKGKSLLKKSSVVKSSVPSNATILESNKPLPSCLLTSPQRESSWRSASGSKDASDSAAVTSSASSSASSSAAVVKNPFYLGSNEDSPIKKKVVSRINIKPHFKLASSKLARPAFDFSNTTSVSVNLSFNATNSQPAFNLSSSLPSLNVSETHPISNSSASIDFALPNAQTLSSLRDQSSTQSLTSAFHNIETLADSLSQTRPLNLNSPTPSARCSNVSFQIPQSSQSIQLQNATPMSSASTFSFFEEVNASISQNPSPPSLPPSNTTSIYNILNKETLHPLVLHREKHRYGDITFINGLVTNVSHHPRNLYFFSAIPVINNQIFTVKVRELFNLRNNEVVLGFTAVDPCGLNVLELPDPLALVDRLEYWVFETFKFQTNDEIKFQFKPTGNVDFYKNYRYANTFFVDATITLWLFLYIKDGIRRFSVKTNERTDLSVIQAMDRPLEQMNTAVNTGVRPNSELSNENILQNNSIWNFRTPLVNVRNAARRNDGNNGVQSVNVLRRNPVSSNAGQSVPLLGIPEAQHSHARLINTARDRLGVNINYINEQSNSDILNRNSIQFSNETDHDMGVNQSNPSRNVNHANKPVISKLKRQERENECIICCDKVIDCVLYTCGHSCMCLECAISILRQGDSKCPICRKIICDVIKIYKS